jgi:hypothetical protein
MEHGCGSFPVWLFSGVRHSGGADDGRDGGGAPGAGPGGRGSTAERAACAPAHALWWPVCHAPPKPRARQPRSGTAPVTRAQQLTGAGTGADAAAKDIAEPLRRGSRQPTSPPSAEPHPWSMVVVGARRNITRCLGVSWLRFLHNCRRPGCASGSVSHDREGFSIIFRSKSFAIMKYLLRVAITSASGVPAGTIPGVITLARAGARPHIRQNWPRLRLANETLRFISRRVLTTTTMEHCRGCSGPVTARGLVPVVRERPLRRAARRARLPGQARARPAPGPRQAKPGPRQAKPGPRPAKPGPRPESSACGRDQEFTWRFWEPCHCPARPPVGISALTR